MSRWVHTDCNVTELFVVSSKGTCTCNIPYIAFLYICKSTFMYEMYYMYSCMYINLVVIFIAINVVEALWSSRASNHF